MLTVGATSTPNFTVTPISRATAAPIVGAAAQPGEPAQIDLRAVLAVTTRSGLRFWIAPGANGICIFARQHGRVPRRSGQRVELAGMWDIIRAPDGTSTFVGVVPKTNARVTFDLKGGATRTVPVVDGVVITPDAGITVTHMRGADGRPSPARDGPLGR